VDVAREAVAFGGERRLLCLVREPGEVKGQCGVLRQGVGDLHVRGPHRGVSGQPDRHAAQTAIADAEWNGHECRGAEPSKMFTLLH
jgi:hypothetical protein